jgi:hypothetical protein
MPRNLRLGPDLAVPDDAVTQTFLILGKRGSGKTNTAVVLAEEMHRVGAPFVVLDPIGAWWGLKSSFDGAGVGLPVYVFGGQHGDLPLQPTAGELMAQVFIRHRQPMVLDMKGWGTRDRARFVTAFAKWLLNHNDRVPSHVFLEEADAFIPQRPYKDEEEMLGAMDRLVRWGRQEGLGSSTVSQRSAKINKDVTTQTEILIAHRTTGPQDRDVVRDWIKYHAGDERMHEILESLATLPDGTAWVWSPEWLGLLRQVAFRRRDTFDSAGTPKLGEKRVQPKELAPVDLDRLRDQLAETIEKARAEDPRELKKLVRDNAVKAARAIADLERQLRERPVAEPQIVKVPVLNGQVEKLGELIGQMREISSGLVLVGTGIGQAAEAITSAIDRVAAAPRPAQQSTVAAGARHPAGRTGAPSATPGELSGAANARSVPRSPGGAPSETGGGEKPLSAYGRRLLDTLARHHPLALTRAQLGLLSGSSRKSSGFDGAIAELRRRQLVDIGAGLMSVSQAGWDELGDMPPAPLTAADTRAQWQASLPSAARRLFDVLVDAYPEALTKSAVAERSGSSEKSSAFDGGLALLRRAGLLEDTPDGMRAAAALFMDAGERP